MKKILLSSLVAASLAVASETIQLEAGWQLLGTSESIKDMSIFDNGAIKTVWIFDKVTESWKAFSNDSDIKKLIEESNITSPLYSIDSNKGFWIDARYSSVLTIPTDIVDANSTSNVNPNYFLDTLKDVTVDMLAGKSMKIIKHTFNSDKLEYRTITFDSDGIATYTVQPDTCYDKNATEATITLKVEDSSLNFYLDNNPPISYKLLASNSVGDVFGVQDSTPYVYSKYTPAPVFYVLNSDTLESPVDMSKKAYPLDIYFDYFYNDNSHLTFDTNLSATYYSYDGSYDAGTYSFGDAGQILLTDSYTTDEGIYGNDSKEEYQTIYSIGRYDVVKSSYVGDDWSTGVYIDDNTTVNLADQNITNWNQLFVATDKVFHGSTYESNGTISYNSVASDDTYTISDDGRTLTTTHQDACYGPESDTITDDYKIVNNWNDVYALLTSSSPIIYGSDLPRFRVLNGVKEPKKVTLHELMIKRASKATWNR